MVFVGGYPRFQYDGYWVTFVDPWPETWPPTWHQTDDVYLDYTDVGTICMTACTPAPGSPSRSRFNWMDASRTGGAPKDPGSGALARRDPARA
jgi:hypothetical protein